MSVYCTVVFYFIMKQYLLMWHHYNQERQRDTILFVASFGLLWSLYPKRQMSSSFKAPIVRNEICLRKIVSKIKLDQNLHHSILYIQSVSNSIHFTDFYLLYCFQFCYRFYLYHKFVFFMIRPICVCVYIITKTN